MSWGIVMKHYIFDFHVIMMDVLQNSFYALTLGESERLISVNVSFARHGLNMETSGSELGRHP